MILLFVVIVDFTGLPKFQQYLQERNF